MAHVTKWYDDKNLVVVRFSHEVVGSEAVSAFDQLSQNGKLNRVKYVLWDCRFIDLLDMDWNHMTKLKELAYKRCSEYPFQGKMAFLYSRSIVYTTCRAICSLTRKPDNEKKIFQTIGEAEEWFEILELSELSSIEENNLS